MSSTLMTLGKELEDLLRLRTRIIGFKRFLREEDLQSIPNLQRMGHYSYFCQLVTYCRTGSVPVGASKKDVTPNCATVVGLMEVPPEGQDGMAFGKTWVTTKEDARKRMDSIPRIPVNEKGAILLSPLTVFEFEPDVILAYGTPAQMMFIINALQLTDYEVLHFYSVGETACSDALVRCYLTGKPALTIPCVGERRIGHVAEDELVFAIPPGHLKKVVDNMKELFKRGLWYPIRHRGTYADLSVMQHPAYVDTWLNPYRGKK